MDVSYQRVPYERVLYEWCLRSPAMTILTTDKMQLFYSVVRTYSRLLVVAGLGVAFPSGLSPLHTAQVGLKSIRSSGLKGIRPGGLNDSPQFLDSSSTLQINSQSPLRMSRGLLDFAYDSNEYRKY